MRLNQYCSPRACVRPCLTVIVIVVVVELLVFNCLAVLSLWYMRGVLSSVIDTINSPGKFLSDKLLVNPLVSFGKDGHFVKIIQETLERVYIETVQSGQCNSSTAGQCQRLSTLGVDVSKAGEALYIYKRIQQHNGKVRRWSYLIVDIGSNDGFLSSNSFNFIQWGWDAVLVEPQPDQMSLAKRNLNRYIDRYGEKSQIVQFVEAVLGDRDGQERLLKPQDLVQMESRILNEGEDAEETEETIPVKSYTVKTFAEKYKIPKAFGILSVDAEGSSAKILHQWIHLGFRPAYIIYEKLHETETAYETTSFLEKNGYRFLSNRSWNLLFEYKTYRDST